MVISNKEVKENIDAWIDKTEFEFLLFSKDFLKDEYITDDIILEKYNPIRHTVMRALKRHNENMINFLLKYHLTTQREVDNYRRVAKILGYN